MCYVALMNGWLKALIAATCVAVIAFIGYYFFREAERAAAEQAAIDRARQVAMDAKREEMCNVVAERFRVWDRWAELGRPELSGSEDERKEARAVADLYNC
jgi:hypothetical protein